MHANTAKFFLITK